MLFYYYGNQFLLYKIHKSYGTAHALKLVIVSALQGLYMYNLEQALMLAPSCPAVQILLEAFQAMR